MMVWWSYAALLKINYIYRLILFLLLCRVVYNKANKYHEQSEECSEKNGEEKNKLARGDLECTVPVRGTLY